MPIVIKKRLILVDARETEWIGRDGQLVKKWKYTFLQKDGNLLEGYDDTGFYKNHVQFVDRWDESKAKDYEWSAKLWNGKTKYSLFVASFESEEKVKAKVVVQDKK